MKTSDLVPPILQKLFNHVSQPREVYARFDDALRACASDGYEASLIPEVVAQKTRRVAVGEYDPQAATPVLGVANISLGLTLAAAKAGRNATLRVLDVGGACGAHFFCARETVKNLSLRWCVLETRAMVARAQEFVRGDLNFASSLSEGLAWLGGVDFLHASSVLQYLPLPFESLDEFLSINAETVLFSRLPLTEGKSFSIVQKSRLASNGPGPLPAGLPNPSVAYPVSFINRQDFEAAISAKYEIAASYWDPGGNYNTPRGLIEGRSYILSRRHEVTDKGVEDGVTK